MYEPYLTKRFQRWLRRIRREIEDSSPVVSESLRYFPPTFYSSFTSNANSISPLRIDPRDVQLYRRGGGGGNSYFKRKFRGNTLAADFLNYRHTIAAAID